MMPSERGTPPEIVHNTPVPAQVMHSNTLRRFTPRSPSLFLDSLICCFSRANVVGLTQERLGARAVYSRAIVCTPSSLGINDGPHRSIAQDCRPPAPTRRSSAG